MSIHEIYSCLLNPNKSLCIDEKKDVDKHQGTVMKNVTRHNRLMHKTMERCFSEQFSFLKKESSYLLMYHAMFFMAVMS